MERELATGAAAALEGNNGKARVCARRAAGAAIEYWLQSHPGRLSSIDALNRLREVSRDSEVPSGVRMAAARLTSRITPEFRSPHPEDPLEDAGVLVDYFLGGG